MKNLSAMLLAFLAFYGTPASMRASTDDVHDTPYQIDFGASQDGWTAVDMSETPGKTWAYNERGYYSKGTYYPCVAMTPDYSSAYDDWYVSPPVRLRAGVEYEVRTLAFNSIGESRVQLYVGTQDGGVDGMTPAGDIEMGQDYAPEAYTLTKVSVGEDGAYRFALRGTTEMYVPDWACLMSFAVDEADRPDGPGHAEAAVPYGIDFTSGADGWTAADINGDEPHGSSLTEWAWPSAHPKRMTTSSPPCSRSRKERPIRLR